MEVISKCFSQVGILVLWEHLTSKQKDLWLSLSSFDQLLFFLIDVNISMAFCVNATFMGIERLPAEILQQDLPN